MAILVRTDIVFTILDDGYDILFTILDDVVSTCCGPLLAGVFLIDMLTVYQWRPSVAVTHWVFQYCYVLPVYQWWPSVAVTHWVVQDC